MRKILSVMANIDPTIIAAFFNGELNIVPIATGLINTTYKVETQSGNFILQKINTKIFTEPEALQTNYKRIRNELRSSGSFMLPALIKTQSGELLFKHKQEAWRCFEFIDNSYSPASVSDLIQLKTLAASFGSFTCALNKINTHELAVILPRFHDLQFRFDQFKEALINAEEERRKAVRELITFIENDQTPIALFNFIGQHTDVFPLHIMHHDCKISNILFRQDNDQIICPIDMDTTMPGYFFSDLGDMIRTLAADKTEDDPGYADMKLSDEKLEILIGAYIEQVQEIFSPQEMNFLVYSGHIMSYMQCLRFLTDHLNGNIYYAVQYPAHNSVRAKNQWQLYSLLKQKIPFQSFNFSF